MTFSRLHPLPVLLALLLASAACGSDSPSEPAENEIDSRPIPNISGTWEILITEAHAGSAECQSAALRVDLFQQAGQIKGTNLIGGQLICDGQGVAVIPPNSAVSGNVTRDSTIYLNVAADVQDTWIHEGRISANRDTLRGTFRASSARGDWIGVLLE